jgi:small subunit ribosomal protein S2
MTETVSVTNVTSTTNNIAKFNIKDLLDAGVHFGHKTMRWNPKMAPYIYGEKNGIHIIDLQKTAFLLKRALEVVYQVAKNNGRILFVGTKTQAQEIVAERAKKCGQYYVNFRWLGGMLTNWPTVSRSIKTLKDMEATIQVQDNLSLGAEADGVRLTKKERLELARKAEKLNKSLGGIAEMGARPDLLFVIDVNKDDLAIKEANKLGIPVVAILDSNSNPDGIDYPIPGNDDAIRAISIISDLVADSAINGIHEALVAAGVDLGESQDFGALRNLKAKNANPKHNARPARSNNKADSSTHAAAGDKAVEQAPAKKTAKKAE